MLCTFNDNARYKRYHIVHAVKKDVDKIKREEFNGKEEREDDYGTSVISIQMLKTGGFISIKNRYNHTVSGCDNTFNSNPDNIINGLSAALKDRFDVDFSINESPLPRDFTVVGNQIFKYNKEINNIYYGDQSWAKDGTIHTVDRSAGDALFDKFLFDNKSKTLKKVDPLSRDSFADDFNRCYSGNSGMSIQNGNLTLNGDILIGAEQSQIKSLYLPDLTTMGNYCLCYAYTLNQFEAPKLTTMGYSCLYYAFELTQFKAPTLTIMGNECLHNISALTRFEAPSLTKMGDQCLYYAFELTQFKAPILTIMSNSCLCHANALMQFESPSLNSAPSHLKHFNDPLRRIVKKIKTWCR